MNIKSLMECIPSHGLFRTGHLLAGIADPTGIRRQLDRWMTRGVITQLRRGVYLLNQPYRKGEIHPFTIAGYLQKSSYISLQSALSHYGMIPEYVPTITSVTTGRPEELETPMGRFHFRHITPRLFWGFQEVEVSKGQAVLLASPEKALIDWLYLTSRSDEEETLRELRLEFPEVFSWSDFNEMLTRVGSSKLMRAGERLYLIWEEQQANETTLV